MAKNSIASKVDRAGELCFALKKMQTEFDQLKKDLKAYAKKHKKKKIDGTLYKAKFSIYAKSECESEVLFDTMTELEMQDQFWDLVNVKVGQAAEVLGDAVFKNISTQYSDKYGKISFNQLKK